VQAAVPWRIGPQLAALRGEQDAGGLVTSAKSGRMASTMGCTWFGWMLHMRRKPNCSRARRASSRRPPRVVQFGRHVVRGHHAVAEGGGGDGALGARHQRMFELARGFSSPRRESRRGAADEIHQAEVQRLDAGQGGDVFHLAQRAVGLDQHMAGICRSSLAVLHRWRRAPSASSARPGAGNLRQDDVGQPGPARADDDFQVAAPVRMGDVVDARADASVAVGRPS
jgi:hypothetical protein